MPRFFRRESAASQKLDKNLLQIKIYLAEIKDAIKTMNALLESTEALRREYIRLKTESVKEDLRRIAEPDPVNPNAARF